MLLITIDRSDPTPAYRQICARIVTLVEDGTLRPGDRLPPTRTLAGTAGVHRSTVVRAFEELRALGYLESRSGSYSTVRHRSRPPATHAATETRLTDWDRFVSPAARAVHDLASESTPPARDNDVIDLDRLSADPTLAPEAALRRCVNTVLQQHRAAALDYTEPTGWHALREVLSVRMRTHGISVSDDEIMVTAGAQQALDLVLRALSRPGDRVVVEAPTYGLAHALLRLHGLRPVEVPMLDDGMDLDALEQALHRQGPKLVYTMPNFHNPTGVTTTQVHRERLLALCEAHHVPIVEDGFKEEMKYLGPAVLPIKSIDAGGMVLYVGTFSKVVFPGLRVGWIAGPPRAIEVLTALQQAAAVAGNTLAQATAARFCSGGHFEAYLRRIHRVYRRRMHALLDGLEHHLPPTARWTRPVGGYTVWLSVPKAGDDAEQRLHESFNRAGVLVSPGSRYFAHPPRTPHFRLSIACVGEERIEEGCRRLGDVLARWSNGAR